jgi:solute carrier family 25 carnitine/acylcarnitine transporter 20/29
MTDHHPVDHFVAGQIGGMFGVIAGQPADTIKVLMQTQTKNRITRSISRILLQVPLRPSWRNRELISEKKTRYTSISRAIFDLYSRDGFRGFYRGVGYPLLATGTQKALAFGVSSSVLELHRQRRRNSQRNSTKTTKVTETPRPYLIDLISAGVAAGITNTILCTPVDQLKIAQQTRLPTPLSFIGTASSLIYNFENRILPSLYGAWRVTLLRECVGYGFYFSFYEVLTRNILRITQKKETTPLMHFCCGGLTGSTMWLAYYPIDAVKSRQQASISRYRGKLKSKPILTGTEMFVRMWKTRKKGIYRGLTPALLRAFPAHGSIFLGYEFSIKLLSWIRRE